MNSCVIITGEIKCISWPPEEVLLSPSTDKGGAIWKQFREGDKVVITGKNMKVILREGE